MNDKKIKILLTTVSLIILTLTLTITIFTKNHKENIEKYEYSKCVDDDGNAISSVANDPYAKGYNSEGIIMFIDSKAAFEASKIDYKISIDYLEKYTKLPKYSYKKSYIGFYKDKAWQIDPDFDSNDSNEIEKNLVKFTQFLDILENSFK